MKFHACKSDDGRFYIQAEDGFVASYLNGEWVNKLMFDAYQERDEFSLIQEPEEAQSIFDWAKTALAGKGTEIDT